MRKLTSLSTFFSEYSLVILKFFFCQKYCNVFQINDIFMSGWHFCVGKMSSSFKKKSIMYIFKANIHLFGKIPDFSLLTFPGMYLIGEISLRNFQLWENIFLLFNVPCGLMGGRPFLVLNLLFSSLIFVSLHWLP